MPTPIDPNLDDEEEEEYDDFDEEALGEEVLDEVPEPLLVMVPEQKIPGFNPLPVIFLVALFFAGCGIYGTFSYALTPRWITMAAAVGFVLGPVLHLCGRRAERLRIASNGALLRNNAEVVTLHASSLAAALKFLGMLIMAPELFLWAYAFPDRLHDGHRIDQAGEARLMLWGIFGLFTFIMLLRFGMTIDRDRIALNAEELSIPPEEPIALREIRRLKTQYRGLEIQLYNPPAVTEAAKRENLSEKRRLVTFIEAKLPVAAGDLAQAVAERVTKIRASSAEGSENRLDRHLPSVKG